MWCHRDLWLLQTSKAESCLLLPKWLPHGQKKLGLEAQPSGDQHPVPCLGISGKQEQPTSPLGHLVVPSLTMEQNISLKKP